MRLITAAVGLVFLAGCVTVQRSPRMQRTAVSAAACDSAASIAAQRAHLASVARTLGEISTGAGQNAYSTVDARVAAPAPAVAAPNAAAASVTSSMIANANNARVELWYTEARKDRSEYQIVVGQIASLDAVALTLPTPKSCRVAGFASSAGATD